jgi:thioredoxin-like negative regulator of GroEL
MANIKNSNGKSGNRSQAIREALAENPHAGSREIVTQLAKKGIKVSATLVYYVRSKQNQQKRRQKYERVALASRATAATNPVALVLRVKELSREVGGIRHLKQLVDLLAE